MCHTFSTLFFERIFNFMRIINEKEANVDSTPQWYLRSPIIYVTNFSWHFTIIVVCLFPLLFCQWHSGKSARNYKRRKFLILNIRALNYPQGLTDDCFEAKSNSSLVGVCCCTRWHAEIYISVVSFPKTLLLFQCGRQKLNIKYF